MFEYAGYVWRRGSSPEFWKRFIRQPVETTKAIRKQPEMRRNMLTHAKLNPTCAASGLTPIQVHHKKPAANYPSLAADPDNFISLHPDFHLKLVGHPRGTKSYNPNVERDAAELLEIFIRIENECILTKSNKWFEERKAG